MIDASAAIACFFIDERPPTTVAIGRRAAIDGAVAPAHWPTEVANALLVAERGQRLQPKDTDAFQELVAHWRLTIEPGDTGRACGAVMALAREHALTIYDAAYLELALRRSLDLATFDHALARAARARGVTLIGAPA